MAETTKVTTDHQTIRRWAEKHDGHPARVKRTGRGEDPGILRLDFPGFSGEDTLEPIAWDKFLRWFDENELALIYREKDRFNKLVSRHTVEERQRARPAARARRSTAKPARAASPGRRKNRSAGAGQGRKPAGKRRRAR